MIKKLLCFFGFHKWINIDDYFPTPKDGEMICFQNLHECKNCKKQEYKGIVFGWNTIWLKIKALSKL